jgi:Ran-binding protein 1
MIPNASNDKTWVWTAFDFSDESLAETSFALRLGSADLAQEFKAKFEEAKISNQALMSGANLPTDAAVEEATSAIESLTVKPAEDAKPEESEPEASPEQKQVG